MIPIDSAIECCLQGCILYPDDAIFNGKKANRTKGYNVSCKGDDIIEEFHQKYVPRKLRKDKECPWRVSTSGVARDGGSITSSSFQAPSSKLQDSAWTLCLGSDGRNQLS
eukprot:s6606_g1.t1